MHQLTFVGPRQFEWREVKAPKIADAGQAIVRPLAVTRCDLDLYIANGMAPMKGEPFAFGHEIAGEVVEIGDAVTAAVPGDKVIVPFQINCGTCDNCRRGFTNACTSVPAYSAYGLAPSSGREWGGGLSDFVLVPYADAMLVKIPGDVAMPVAAAISDNAVDGYRTIEQPLIDRPGADVLIVGGLAQSVGLFAAQAAKALGAGRVVYADFDADRLNRAMTLGVEARHVQYQLGMRVKDQFPIVVDASNLSDGLIYALKSTAPCGVCTGVSAGTPTMDGLPLGQMYMKGISFTISRAHARAGIDDVLDCARCGHIKHGEIITRNVPFSNAADVMTDPDIKIVFIAD
ncbi:MAG: alcohol dehydrogenase catalytic domain-containing protein [Sphingorhabdus sp.]